MEFTTWHNFKPTDGEVNKEPSMTVPDMSYSIQELLDNFTRMPEIAKPAIWLEEPDIENPFPASPDLTDLTQIGEKVNYIKSELEALKTPDNAIQSKAAEE